MDITLADLKFEKYLTATHADDIRSYAKTMNNADMTHFSYVRLYQGPRVITFTTNPEFSEFFIKNQLYKDAFFDDVSNYTPGIYLWNHFEKNTALANSVFKMLQIQCGMTIIQPGPDESVEFFYFASKNDPIVGDHFFINHLDYFKNVCVGFKETCHDIIKKSEKNRLIYPGHYSDKHHMLSEDYNHFKSLVSEFNPFQLTKREMECAKGLCKGYSAKEIARELNISYRTVEQHLVNIKHKLGANSIRHAVAMLARYCSH